MANSSIPIARPNLSEAEKAAVMRVMESGMIASGPEVRRFEQRFAAYSGAAEGIATTSGTTALHVALLAAGIGPGDAVITTPFTFIATSNAILFCGARPIFADVDYATCNITADEIRRAAAANPEARAVLVVHLFGLPCDMDAVNKAAAEYGLAVIEDCAQAHGAEYRSRRVGSIGLLSAFSFYPTKNMTCGEGGMVLTSDPELAETCRLIINHGSKVRYRHEILGYNYRMTDIAAAIGNCQLDRLEGFNEARSANAALLSERLGGLSGLEVPFVPEGCRHVYHQYTVKVRSERQGLVDFLTERGVGYGLFYPCPSYSQPLYREMGFEQGTCPVAEQLSEQVVSLPVHPLLRREEVLTVAETVREWALAGAGG